MGLCTSPDLNKIPLFLFIRLMFVNDTVLCLYTFVYQGWHVWNAVKRVPEVMLSKRCFYLVAPQTFFASVNQLTDLLIALDRFTTLVSANKKSKRTTKRIKGILLFSMSVYVSGFFDSFDQSVPLTYCAYRVALSRVSSWALWAMSFTVNATIWCCLSKRA